MGSLIRYELKKMLSRRVSQVSIAAVLALVAVIAFFSITSQYALDPKEMGTEFEGTAAIAQIKANTEALAGPITDEEATEALREFKEFVGPDGEVKEEYRTDRKPYGEKANEYWEFSAKNGALMALLTSPWMQGYQMPVSAAAAIDTTGTVDLYGRVRSKIASGSTRTGPSRTTTMRGRSGARGRKACKRPSSTDTQEDGRTSSTSPSSSYSRCSQS